MPIRRLRDYLDSHQAKYYLISHSPAYTAQEIAATAHVSGRLLAKTVMVSVDGKMAMVVLPASRQLDFELLRALCGTNDVALADEPESFPNARSAPCLRSATCMAWTSLPTMNSTRRQTMTSPSTPDSTPSCSGCRGRITKDWSIL